jgi:hypothetical protein
VFTIPHWTWASQPAARGELFIVTDRAIYERLDLLREEVTGIGAGPARRGPAFSHRHGRFVDDLTPRRAALRYRALAHPHARF